MVHGKISQSRSLARPHALPAADPKKFNKAEAPDTVCREIVEIGLLSLLLDPVLGWVGVAKTHTFLGGTVTLRTDSMGQVPQGMCRMWQRMRSSTSDARVWSATMGRRRKTRERERDIHIYIEVLILYNYICVCVVVHRWWLLTRDQEIIQQHFQMLIDVWSVQTVGSPGKKEKVVTGMSD